MQIGMIGLERMGANMVQRLIRKGHSCVVFNRSPQVVNGKSPATSPQNAAKRRKTTRSKGLNQWSAWSKYFGISGTF
jgi:6-phosphogluconate dehydrogenase (decarboxylating)